MSIQWRHPRSRMFFLLVFTLCFLSAGFYLGDIVNPLLVALLVSYILNPVVEFFEKKGFSRHTSVALLFLLASLGVALGISVFGIKVYDNITEIRVLIVGEPLVKKKDLEEVAKQGQLVLLGSVETSPEDSERDELGPDFMVDKKAVFAAAGPVYFKDLNGDGAREEGLVKKFVERLQPYLDELSHERVRDLTELLQSSADKVGEVILGVLDSTRGFASSMWNIFSYLVLVPIYAFFFLLNFSGMKKSVREHLPAMYRDRIVEVSQEIDRSVAAFFRGRLIIALIKGVLTGIGLWILGVPFGLPIGIFSGLLSFVPAIGPLVALVASLVLGLGSAHSVVLFTVELLVILVVAEIVEAACYPIVLGKEVGIHPVSLILSFLVFGKLFGLFGVLLAVPTASVVKILFRQFVLPEIEELARPEVDGPVEVPNAEQTESATAEASSGESESAESSEPVAEVELEKVPVVEGAGASEGQEEGGEGQVDNE